MADLRKSSARVDKREGRLNTYLVDGDHARVVPSLGAIRHGRCADEAAILIKAIGTLSDDRWEMAIAQLPLAQEVLEVEVQGAVIAFPQRFHVLKLVKATVPTIVLCPGSTDQIE